MAVLRNTLLRDDNARDLATRLHLDIIVNVDPRSIINCAPGGAFEPAPVSVALTSAAAADGHQTGAAAGPILSFVAHVRAVLVPGHSH